MESRDSEQRRASRQGKHAAAPSVAVRIASSSGQGDAVCPQCGYPEAFEEVWCSGPEVGNSWLVCARCGYSHDEIVTNRPPGVVRFSKDWTPRYVTKASKGNGGYLIRWSDGREEAGCLRKGKLRSFLEGVRRGHQKGRISSAWYAKKVGDKWYQVDAIGGKKRRFPRRVSMLYGYAED